VQEDETAVLHAAHRYEDCRRDDLLRYEIFDYIPGHSSVYRQWLQQQPARYNWDRWVVTGIIGVLVGFTGLFMQQIYMSAADFKWTYTEHFIQVFPALSTLIMRSLSVDQSVCSEVIKPCVQWKCKSCALSSILDNGIQI